MNKNEIVSFIYKTNILKLGTVKLKNGDFSDYIYDFGKVYSPDDLSRLAFWMVNAIRDIDFNVIFTSVKGITLATAVALEYKSRFPFKSIKMGYIRKEEKDYGEEGYIVGYSPQKNDRVLMIDDVITTLGSQKEMHKYIVSQLAYPVGSIVVISRINQKYLDEAEQILNIPLRYLIHDSDIIKKFNSYYPT